MDDQGSPSVDFLLAEYRICMDEFRRSEEVGEKRVNFFITVTTAVLAALAALAAKGKGSGSEVDPRLAKSIFFYAIGAVLLFGVVTLMRLIHRNLESHKQLRAMGRVRRYFTERDNEVLNHLSFPPYDDRPQRKKEWKEIFSFGTGGLVETVSLVNSLIVYIIVAAVCALLPISLSIWIIALFGLIGSLAAWIAQFAYVKYRYDKEKPTKSKFPGPRD